MNTFQICNYSKFTSPSPQKYKNLLNVGFSARTDPIKPFVIVIEESFLNVEHQCALQT
jgi:hypothetical protein